MYYDFWLANIPGIGNKKIRKILTYAQEPKTAYELNESQLKRIPGLSQREVQAVLEAENDVEIKEKYDRMKMKGVRFISQLDENYPDKLQCLEEPPFGLYVKGRLPNEEIPSIAIIGARRCSQYGRAVAEEFAKVLAKHGVQIISGMAKGIDGIGQLSAVEEGGMSFGVLGCGVDICYPRENIDLYMRIQKKGGLISEYSIETQPKAHLFPPRNRLISGLADILLIIEAKEKGGSLITVEYALEQGKDVFVVPGRICDSLSSGCNELIKQGAGVVTSPKDVLEVLGIKNEKIYSENIKKQLKSNITLEKKQLIVYSCLSLEPRNIESLIQEVKLSVPEITNILVTLQMIGLVFEPAKNYYVRTNIKWDS